MMRAQPIGIFDSGYGGLTILREIHKSLPHNDFIYLGDNLRAPYGPKDFETVYAYTLQAVKWFFSRGCNLIILACNTASAKALRSIQQNDLAQLDAQKRVLGVIRPSAEIIGDYSRNGHLGILATEGTVVSNSYLLEIEKFYPDVKVTQHACPSWVPLVEKNLYDTIDADSPVKEDLQKLLQQDNNIDTILLGCTHYPLLLKKIEENISPSIKVISQGKIVADSLKKYLARHQGMNEGCSKNNNLEFYTTGSVEDFNAHASIFFGKSILSKKITL